MRTAMGWWIRALAGAAVAALGMMSAGMASAEPPGPEVCKGCHEAQFDTFTSSVHGKAGHPRSPASNGGCFACHGDGTEHVKAGGGRGVGGIVNPASPKLTGAEKDRICLTCHESNRHLAFWDSGKHRKNDVSCTNCHSTHGDRDTLLKIKNPEIAPFKTTVRVPQQEVCFTCHRDIRGLVSRPSHHPIVEGKVKCTSCHNPHGALSPAMVNAESIKELCTTCHADKRGPFMFEHPPVEESCLNCHNPHGSRSVKLLNEKVPNLCQDCHDASSHPGTMYDADANFKAPSGPTSGPNSRFIARSCLNCHNEIHGSNSPAGRGRRFVR
jgi:DmsE family decaheme c-type cytochrome